MAAKSKHWNKVSHLYEVGLSFFSALCPVEHGREASPLDAETFNLFSHFVGHFLNFRCSNVWEIRQARLPHTSRYKGQQTTLLYKMEEANAISIPCDVGKIQTDLPNN